MANNTDPAVSVCFTVRIDDDDLGWFNTCEGLGLEVVIEQREEGGNNGFVWQQTFDFTYTDTFNLPPALFTAPRFDVLGIIGYIGTSQATPHVSGVAAMLMQQGITDPAAVEAALERLATDLGDPGRDPQYGFGLIEARNTLRGLGIAK